MSTEVSPGEFLRSEGNSSKKTKLVTQEEEMISDGSWKSEIAVKYETEPPQVHPKEETEEKKVKVEEKCRRLERRR